MSTRPSGTVTFLFTDVENSSRLWDEHPDAMRAALARHDTILRQAIKAHEGFVFSTGGDGLAAAFQRSSNAIETAIEAQRMLQSEVWPESVVVRVRMGIHTGEAQERDRNYFGPPLNLAARLMAVAHGGEIVVSNATAEVLGRVAGVDLVDFGMHRLRGLGQRVHVFGLRAEGLTPPDLPVAASQSSAGDLPVPATEFIGRSGPLEQVSASLASHRLVTLTGPGGVGKTRLAIEIAWSKVDEFSGGSWLADLAAVNEPSAVATAVLSLFAIQPETGMTLVDSIVDWLRGRHLLLVLDNCEHVVAPVSQIVSGVMARCPTVAVLATSRQPLGVPGERVYPLPPLDPASDAVELFCDRATAADGSCVLSDADRDVILSICRRLDGMPLAIELAAARIRALGLGGLLTHLDDRFRVLRGGTTEAGGRHQTLRATFDWSYHLLSESEQLLFGRLSVFAGSFDLAAAEAACSGDGVDELDVLDLLSSLVDKSMVVADHGAGMTRYYLLESLRQYGAERLDQGGETLRMRDRHLAHYVDVARKASAVWAGPLQLDADAVFDRAWDNIRAAHSWAVARRNDAAAHALVASTGPHAWYRVLHEHGAWASRTLDLASPDMYATAVTGGWVAYWLYIAGDYQHAIEAARNGIGAASGPEQPETTGCWVVLAWAYSLTGDSGRQHEAVRAAAAAAAKADALFRTLADVVVVEEAMDGRWPGVDDLVDEFTLRTAAIGAPSLMLRALLYEAHLKLRAGSAGADEARAAYGRGLQLARTSRDTNHESIMLWAAIYAATRLRIADAPQVCRDALLRLPRHPLLATGPAGSRQCGGLVRVHW